MHDLVKEPASDDDVVWIPEKETRAKIRDILTAHVDALTSPVAETSEEAEETVCKTA
eukprot:COSAG01_NODE_41714_length_448_cov_0.848138_1_plen_56_part_10